MAPLIPVLNDRRPAILEAAAARGARWANYILVRRPGASTTGLTMAPSCLPALAARIRGPSIAVTNTS